MSKKEIDKYWDSIEDNPMVIVSRLRGMMTEAADKWADECSDFLSDEAIDSVLKLVLQLMDGSMPDPAKVAAMVVRLEAFNVKFRMQYNAYMSYKKGTDEANAKKNHYYSMTAGIDKLCDGLKYLAR